MLHNEVLLTQAAFCLPRSPALPLRWRDQGFKERALHPETLKEGTDVHRRLLARMRAAEGVNPMHMVQACVQQMRWVQRSELASVTSPALLVSGESDRITKAEWAQARREPMVFQVPMVFLLEFGRFVISARACWIRAQLLALPLRCCARAGAFGSAPEGRRGPHSHRCKSPGAAAAPRKSSHLLEHYMSARSAAVSFSILASLRIECTPFSMSSRRPHFDSTPLWLWHGR